MPVYNNGSGLNCSLILIFTYAHALIFIHRSLGSLFLLLRVLIGSLFHKKMGPYLKAWGSLLVLEAVGEEGRSRVVERYIGEGDRGVGKGQVKFGDLIERY